MSTGDEGYLDLNGLKCPQPVLRTRRAMRRLATGATLRVDCTDPLAAIDIPNLVRESGYALLSVDRAGAVLTFRIRKPTT